MYHILQGLQSVDYWARKKESRHLFCHQSTLVFNPRCPFLLLTPRHVCDILERSHIVKGREKFGS